MGLVKTLLLGRAVICGMVIGANLAAMLDNMYHGRAGLMLLSMFVAYMWAAVATRCYDEAVDCMREEK